MKVRRGFVSNSSSTCFICGEWIDEGKDICDGCFTKKIQREADKFARWICEKEGLNYHALYDEYVATVKSKLGFDIQEDDNGKHL